MAFSLFGKKPPAKPAKAPVAPRKQEARKPAPVSTPDVEEDSFSLDFTNYSPPATVLSETPADLSPASEPAAAPVVAKAETPVEVEAPAGPVSLPALDFDSLPGATSASASEAAVSVPAVSVSGGTPSQKADSGAPLDSILLIEVESGAQEVPTVVEEAAVLFANGQSEEALETLNRAIEAGTLDTWTLPAWLMRFDLYQQLGRKSEFEEKALHFVVKFERSPPAWNDLPSATTANRPGGSAHIALSGSLSSASKAAFGQMLKASERHPKLHLDFAKLEGVDAEGCQLLLDTLVALRKAKKEVYISGEARAFELLQAKIADGSATPLWLLLLDLYQQLGMQDEFEEVAVDYAVTFEVSPPSWEARARVEPPPPAGPAGSGARDESDDSYSLEGDIAGEQEALFADLQKYVKQANPVLIDLSRTRRIDFINAGRLLHLIEKAREAKRAVVLRSVGEMMMALFAVMGIHKLARIIPRK